MIKFINIALTNRCNLRCSHCDIWQENYKNDIPLLLIKKIFKSRILNKKINLTVTGGEPFLHRNIINVIDFILKSRPGALKTVSTNGTLVKKILFFLNKSHKRLPHDFSLHISLDGIRRHDKQRGESIKQIMSNIDLIKSKFPDIKLKLKFTITPINYKDILPSYEYAKLNNLGFKIKLVETAKNYTNKIKKKKFYFNRAARNLIIKDLIYIYKDRAMISNRDMDFIKFTIKFLLGKIKNIACMAPFNRLFIMPDGNVYSCIHFDPIGNLNDNKLDELWNSKKAQQIRSNIKRKGCNRCTAYHGFSF